MNCSLPVSDYEQVACSSPSKFRTGLIAAGLLFNTRVTVAEYMTLCRYGDIARKAVISPRNSRFGQWRCTTSPWQKLISLKVRLSLELRMQWRQLTCLLDPPNSEQSRHFQILRGGRLKQLFTARKKDYESLCPRL